MAVQYVHPVDADINHAEALLRNGQRSEAVAMAQVHATLAVARALRELDRTLEVLLPSAGRGS